jgi:RsiW-degrading membrane proteinase PrsW (M82 family)
MLPFALPYFLENARNLELIGVVLCFVFWIQMIRLCLAREPSSSAKFAWLVFIVLVPGLGSLVYFFLRVANRPRI